MPYLTAGIIITIVGVILMKTDTQLLIASFAMTAGIIISFIGSAKLKNKNK